MRRSPVIALSIALLVSAWGCNAVLGWDSATLEAPPDAAKPPPTTDCEIYCDLMDRNCTGANLKYIDNSVCQAMCKVLKEQFEPGAPDDIATNTLACRLNHVRQAIGGTAGHECEAASPLGGGICGGAADLCKSFCQLDTTHCLVAEVPKDTQPYPSFENCMLVCPAFPYKAGIRISDDQDRNTLDCRAYHLEASFVGAQAQQLHCPHTNEKSKTCTGPS